LVVAAAALCAPGAARADQRELVTLDWEAPASCPTKGEMIDRIARIVGPEATHPAPVRARVVVSAEPGGAMRAVLELSAGTETNTREVADATCGALADALALILALAVTPEAGAPPAPATPLPPAPAPTSAPPSLPPASATPSAPAPPSSAARPVIRVAASGIVDAFTFPSAALGGEVAAGVGLSNALVEIDGALLTTQRIGLASSPAEGAAFTLVHAALRGCYAAIVRPLELAPCAGGGVDWLVARGFGSQVPANATATLPVLTLGVRATIPLWTAFSLRLGAEGLAPLARPTFVIGERGDVYHASVAFFRASLGLEAHF